MTFSIRAARKEQIDLFPELAKHTILTCYPPIIGAETVRGYARSGEIAETGGAVAPAAAE